MIPALRLPPEGSTRLVSRPDDLQKLTNRRTTDARTALTRGLAEYLRQLTSVADGGREIRFVKVLEVYAEPEVPSVYPAAVVYGGQPGTYDASEFTPATIKLDSGLAIRSISEYTQPIDVEIWSTDPMERMALVAMLEDMLNPVEWMTGLRLELPHYFNARATYEVSNMAYLDGPEDNQRRWRKAAFSITGNVTQYKPLNVVLPELKPRVAASIDTDVVTAKIPLLPSTPKTVVVYDQGPPGQTGARGPAGPPGPAGAGYDFTQAVPALTWTINHNLGYYPSVELFSVGGMEIDADVLHVSVNQTLITFLIATAGSARLN